MTGTAIERLDFERIDPALQAALTPRVERLGYLGEYFRLAAHVPQAVLAWMPLVDALKAPIATDLVELIALTVASKLGAAYERVQHERLCAKLGFERTWIAQAIALEPDRADRFTPAQAHVARFVIAYLETCGRDADVDALATELGTPQAIAVMQLAGSYASTAMFMNAFALVPPAPSIFADDVR